LQDRPLLLLPLEGRDTVSSHGRRWKGKFAKCLRNFFYKSLNPSGERSPHDLITSYRAHLLIPYVSLIFINITTYLRQTTFKKKRVHLAPSFGSSRALFLCQFSSGGGPWLQLITAEVDQKPKNWVGQALAGQHRPFT
jgi:hypothetical protein